MINKLIYVGRTIRNTSILKRTQEIGTAASDVQKVRYQIVPRQ